MKVSVKWKDLLKLLWASLKPALWAALGAGVVTVTTTGCSSLSTTPRGQTTEIVAVGIPAVAWITHTTQEASHGGGDTNTVVQANPVTTEVPLEIDR